MEIIVDTTTLWIAAGMCWIILPLISAVMIDKNVAGGWRLPKVYLANVVVFALVYVGYWFQRNVDVATGWKSSDAFLTRLDMIRIGLFSRVGGLELICLVSVLVCFGTLLGKNRRERAAFSCRTAFIVFAGFDLILGVLADSAVEVVVKNVIFDFVGAIVFGTFAGVFVSWIFPDSPPPNEIGGAGGVMTAESVPL